MIGEDMSLAVLLFNLASNHSELEAVTQNLSITTFRYVPLDYQATTEAGETYLNQLNESLLNKLQQGGRVFLSNAVVSMKYCLRACIVNFRTSEKDIVESVAVIVDEGRKLHRQHPAKVTH